MTTSIFDRLRELDKRIEVVEARRKERRDNLDRLRDEVQLLSREELLLGKVETTLQHVGSKILGQSTNNIDQLVTRGLRAVFEDQQLEFRTKVERFRGKTAVQFELRENGYAAPLMDAYGGGVLAVAGLLLRVVTIITLDLRRFILADETLAHLSEQYQPNASKLLNRLCGDLKFKILMVSHQPAFAEYANRHYTATATKAGGTIFKEVRSR